MPDRVGKCGRKPLPVSGHKREREPAAEEQYGAHCGTYSEYSEIMVQHSAMIAGAGARGGGGASAAAGQLTPQLAEMGEDMSQGSFRRKMQEVMQSLRGAAAHVAPGAAAAPKTSKRLTSKDLQPLDGSANGEEGLALLKEKNDAMLAEMEAKEGKDAARKDKGTEDIADGRDMWRVVEERVESGEPNVLESLKVPVLKSIRLYLTYEKCSGKKEALQDQLLERSKWKEAVAKGLAAREAREAAVEAERVAADGDPEVAANAGAAGAAVGDFAPLQAAQPGARPGRGRGGRAPAAPPGERQGRGGRGRGRGSGATATPAAQPGGGRAGGRGRGSGRGWGGARGVCGGASIGEVSPWSEASFADVAPCIWRRRRRPWLTKRSVGSLCRFAIPDRGHFQIWSDRRPTHSITGDGCRGRGRRARAWKRLAAHVRTLICFVHHLASSPTPDRTSTLPPRFCGLGSPGNARYIFVHCFTRRPRRTPAMALYTSTGIAGRTPPWPPPPPLPLPPPPPPSVVPRGCVSSSRCSSSPRHHLAFATA